MENLFVEKKIISSKKKNQTLNELEKLGRLPDDFDEKSILPFLKNPNHKVRYLAVKNLAKLSKISLLETYIYLINADENSLVRRESTSAIGRLGKLNRLGRLNRLESVNLKSAMLTLLNDHDPEVILQAIRGLLTFKQDEDIKEKLLTLKNHPNEIIREVIQKEFNLNPNTSKDKNHILSPNFLKNTVVHGDVQEILKSVPDESIHLTFTSPPYYNARDYSLYKSYKEYLDFLENIFGEIHRITKEGRFFLLNTSPIIIPRVGRQYSSKRYPIPYDIHPLLVKMGWEFIDDIVWVKPEASTKNRNAGFLQHRKPLGYKPNACSECVMVYRKKTDKLIDWNIKQYDKKTVEESKIKGDYESSNIWKIDPTFDKTHSAVFPLELCHRVVQLYSFKGDLVFDPFAGSGTVGKASQKLERYFFLTEKKEEYVERMRENFNENLKQKELFENGDSVVSFLNRKEFKNIKFKL